MKNEMNYGSDYKFILETSIESGHGIEVLPDLFCYSETGVSV
ncbi:hypothetical protein QEZ44_18175 [Bacillus cereus]|nr:MULTISPECIES: hypothetical protein [Bacillus]MDH4423328.1 hypothetical protein [Bacillus cereus]